MSQSFIELFVVPFCGILVSYISSCVACILIYERKDQKELYKTIYGRMCVNELVEQTTMGSGLDDETHSEKNLKQPKNIRRMSNPNARVVKYDSDDEEKIEEVEI